MVEQWWFLVAGAALNLGVSFVLLYRSRLVAKDDEWRRHVDQRITRHTESLYQGQRKFDIILRYLRSQGVDTELD